MPYYFASMKSTTGSVYMQDISVIYADQTNRKMVVCRLQRKETQVGLKRSLKLLHVFQSLA